MKISFQPPGNRRLVRAILFVFVSVVFFPACKKGDTGAQGKPGSANVMYSDWFTPASYTKTVAFGLNRLTYDKAVTEITQPILDSGAVLVFGKLNGYVPSIWPTDQAAQLPITVTYLSGTTIENDTWSALTTPGNLRIYFVNDNNLYGSLATTHQFRYVVVPGGVKINAAGINLKKGATANNSVGDAADRNSGWAGLTYEEVCTALNIPE